MTHRSWSNVDDVGMKCAQDPRIFEELDFIRGPDVRVRTGQKHNVMVGVRRINDILRASNVISCIIDPHKFVQVYPVVLQYNGIRINGTNFV